MPILEVNGTTLAYELVGTGPACVVLPGWPGLDHAYLRPALDPLGSRLRLAFVDHSGTGSSGPLAEPCTMEQLADAAASLALTMGDGAVVLLGHHLGAAVALETALRHPDAVSGLVLVAGTPGQLGAGESLGDSLGEEPTPIEVEILQRVPPSTDDELAATMQALSAYFTHRSPPPPEGCFAACSFAAAAAGPMMMASGWWSAVDRLGDITVPALVIVGRHDVVHGPYESTRIASNLPGARLVVLQDSGHLPWLDEPDAFTAAVIDWLDDVGL
ncbi:MAG: alpha/beta hydrolase [Actinomycetota bacterium]|nr:alpha/beta hydrolase [Actinomycetota bacterium]